MTKQSKVAVAESAAKVLTDALLSAVKEIALTERRNQEPVLCWSSRECYAREYQGAMSIANDYYEYAHSMD